MNIEDVAPPTEYPEDILQGIFSRQRELMEKYHPIERNNGLLLCEDIPVDLHDRFGQFRLKDMAWRATEELVESVDAGLHKEHRHEELIDALHFIVEFAIAAGFEPRSIESYFEEDRISTHVYDTIHSLGMACHKLKSKPWKVTHQLTDVNRFYECVDNVFSNFTALLKHEGLRPGDVYDLYFRKATVNSFRQRSQY